MNTTRRFTLPLVRSLLAIGVLGAGSVAAQAPLDTRALPEPQRDSASCDGVIWNTELVSEHPKIAEGCREVIMVNGQKWARFEAEFVERNLDGSYSTEFMDTRNVSLGELRLMPGPDQQVTLDGRKYPFTALQPKQRLNLYVPEGAYDVSLEPVVSAQASVRFVRRDDTENERLAQATPAPAAIPQPDPVDEPYVDAEPAAERLPDTAGPLPWLAVAGALSLLGGGGLRLRRRFSSPS